MRRPSGGLAASWIAVVLLGLAVREAACDVTGGAAASRRPNVVLIVTDDQRWDTLQYMPAVQRLLVARGVTFSNAFTTSPVCQPSRASLLTGRYPHRTGVPRNVDDTRRFVGPDASTVATWLQRAGYRTGFYGKYLNGYVAQCPPFTTSCYRPPGWDEWHAFLLQAYHGFQLAENDAIVSYGDGEENYSTDVLATKAAEFIRTAGAPFFVTIAFHAPHSEGFFFPEPAARHRGAFAALPPFRPASWDEEDMSDKPPWMQNLPRANYPVGSGFLATTAGKLSDDMRRYQLETLLAVDEAVERLLAAVDATGQADDTVVIFTADNGLSWNEHRWLGKGCPYEECLRVPLVIRAPRLASTAREDGRMALNIDLAPTIVELAGERHPRSMDGRSLVRVLRGDPIRWRPAFLFEYFAGTQSTGGGPPSFVGVRTQQRKLVRYGSGVGDELLDLTSDPSELQGTEPGSDREVRRLNRYLRKELFRAPPAE